jgi:hypothetical protein
MCTILVKCIDDLGKLDVENPRTPSVKDIDIYAANSLMADSGKSVV